MNVKQLSMSKNGHFEVRCSTENRGGIRRSAFFAERIFEHFSERRAAGHFAVRTRIKTCGPRLWGVIKAFRPDILQNGANLFCFIETDGDLRVSAVPKLCRVGTK